MHKLFIILAVLITVMIRIQQNIIYILITQTGSICLIILPIVPMYFIFTSQYALVKLLINEVQIIFKCINLLKRVIKLQAEAFSKYTNIFAPYYTQYDIDMFEYSNYNNIQKVMQTNIKILMKYIQIILLIIKK